MLYDDATDTNINAVVQYRDYIESINSIILPSRISLQVHWIPLCIHKQIKKINYYIRELFPYYNNSLTNTGNTNLMNQEKNKIKLVQCEKCVAY
ncbi:MAG: hypothetical protein ACOZBL_02170 [Patescibacteria group bacterium]